MPRILVIEAHADVLSLIVRVLRRARYEVIAARNIGQAIDIARAQTDIDAIILDVAQLGVVGESIDAPATYFRACKRLAALPVIALSSRWDVRAEHAGAAGYAGFIAKPFLLEDLLAEVAACLGGRPAARQCGW